MNDLFDSVESARQKTHGMALAELNRADTLELARRIARNIGKARGSATADDVGRVLKEQYGIETLGPAAGSLFKTSEWAFTGIFRKSARVTNHSRLLRVWKYVA